MEISTQYALSFSNRQFSKSERAELLSNFLGMAFQLRDRKTKELRDATGHDIAIILGHVPTGTFGHFIRVVLRHGVIRDCSGFLLKPKRI